MSVESVVRGVDRATRALERPVVRALRAYLVSAQARLVRELRPAYAQSLGAAAAGAEGRILREARARALLAQTRAAIDALDLSTPRSGVSALLQRAIEDAYREGAREAAAMLESAARGFTGPQSPVSFTAQLPLEAIQAQVTGSVDRLARYSGEATTRINQAVIDGLVAGRNPTAVGREIRAVITGEARSRGGLAFQAETLARTEMMSAVTDARHSGFREAGVEFVAWVATPDERTCDVCASRSGNVYRLRDVVLPAHPRCRCVTVPARREVLDAGAREELREHRESVLREYREEHGGDAVYSRAASAFERAAGKPRPAPVNL